MRFFNKGKRMADTGRKDWMKKILAVSVLGRKYFVLIGQEGKSFPSL